MVIEASPDGLNEAPASLAPALAEEFVVRRMSLRHLRVLLALTDGGSISAAAESLHVTQPAISRTLSELEQGLGQTLFARRGRRIRATALGDRMIQLARRLEAELQRGGEDVASLVRGTSGELLIGATNAALTELMPEAVMAMKAEFPRLEMSVRTHALTTMLEDLRQGRLDLVIARIDPREAPPDLEGLRLLAQDEVLTISNCHPLSKHTAKLSWEQLCGEPWLWPLAGTRMRVLQDRRWQEMGLTLPSNLIQTDDLMMMTGLMRRMPLLAFLPEHVARNAAREGMLKILPLQAELRLTEQSVWHLREAQGEVVERFKQILAEVALRLA